MPSKAEPLAVKHLAIIMDGNGRWAKARGLPRVAGHKQGAETFREIAYHCRDAGLEYLTVYAFSTENWKRGEFEVGAILRLLEDYLEEAIEKMVREGIRLKVIGDLAPLSERAKALIAKTEELSSKLSGFQVNLCVNYGGRNEIIRAARLSAESGKAFEDCLDTAGIPDPDLLIRPGGEKRLSNFLLWQCAYTELSFTDKFWPDITGADIDAAIKEFCCRSRRFGGI
ncbi:MAG: di-trans,poly-cis-decaprenylcistransferase [Oscillospiraceae bacterium]|nr:di-trans,poly-cis-decaprenylcistransferase [Oscillospiraceae bacterium]